MMSSVSRWMIAAAALIAAVGIGKLLAQRPHAVRANQPVASVQPTRPETLREPLPAAPRVATGQRDSLGREITVSCASCHANFTPNSELSSGDALREFHQGLRFAHGRLTCLACHHAENYNWLRLAGGQSLDFSQVPSLCGQCHSKQAADYDRGAHGGMNGYWDARRGPRARKGCVDCHDPHAPAFPAMVPTFRPHDRFLDQKQGDEGSQHE